MKKNGLVFAFAVLFSATCCLTVSGQSSTVITTDLDHPTKVISGPDQTLLVAESGTMTSNTGRISVVDMQTGARRTLLDGLPSGVSNLGGEPDTDGTTGLLLTGDTLYVVSGVGDACINVGPGLELPNPAGASSPIFDSVIELTLPTGYTSLKAGFHMTLADQNELAAGHMIVLQNGSGDMLTVRMAADLPDYRPEPRPGHPDNVRAAHLFGVELFQTSLYINDAGLNLVHRVDLATGNAGPFVLFGAKPNPLFPTLGGPFVDAVPDAIHRVDDHLLIPMLTGFPFVPGLSEVKAVSLVRRNPPARSTPTPVTIIPDLTSAIDVLAVETTGGTSYYVLEFSADMLGGQPGRIKYFDPAGNGSVIVPVVITPTSMVRDETTGSLFVTNIFPGTLTRVDL